MRTRLKFMAIAIIQIVFFVLTNSATSQEINGVVRSKSSTIYFEGFGTGNTIYSGEIHSNLAGSKYTVSLNNDKNEKLEGVITDKWSKLKVDLSYQGKKITGVIEQSPNHTKDEWDIQFLDKKLSGTVIHNMMNTRDTYKLSYGDKKFEGTISDHLNTLKYDLTFGDKKITGPMSYNISTIKHTYHIKVGELTDEEFVVMLFIESIKLINEQIDEIEEFQKN